MTSPHSSLPVALSRAATPKPLGMRLVQQLKAWLKTHNQNGRYVLFGSLVRHLLHFNHFYPLERFTNWLKVQYNTRLRTWQRVTLEKSVIHRVFHICLEDTTTGKRILKLPRGDNPSSCSFLSAIRKNVEFERYKATLDGIKKDPWLGPHCVQVFEVWRDGGYSSEFVAGYNLAQLRNRLSALHAMPQHLRHALVSALEQLVADLHQYQARRGGLIGDWALSNLVFSPAEASIVNVDGEGFFTYKTPNVEANLSLIECELRAIRDYVQLLNSPSPRDSRTLSVLQILDEVRRSGKEYSGKGFLVGYHSLILDGKKFRGQRECSQRLAAVPFNFAEKVVVDLGCNCGGMLHALSKTIKKGYGFDFNPKCVNAAQAVKALNQSSNLEFFNYDFDHDDLSLLGCFVAEEKVDICFLLSVCMWLTRWRALVRQAATLADALLFESNGTPEQQEAQVSLLGASFERVLLLSDNSQDDFLQPSRKLYLCTGSKVRGGSRWPEDGAAHVCVPCNSTGAVLETDVSCASSK